MRLCGNPVAQTLLSVPTDSTPPLVGLAPQPLSARSVLGRSGSASQAGDFRAARMLCVSRLGRNAVKRPTMGRNEQT